jgi:uncharacterized membrane protein YqhA
VRFLVERARWMVLVAVLASLVAAAAAFLWGASETLYALSFIWRTRGHDRLVGVALIQVVDAFLVATGLLIFGVGLYELFIGPLERPGWLMVTNLHDLKSKLASIIVLVMAVTFVERFVDGRVPLELLESGAAAALVGGLLIWYGAKD